jgi:acyl-CoA thioesterase FadM
MEYRVVSLAKQAIVAEGQGVVVSYDYARGRKARLPEAIQRKVAILEGEAEGAKEG